jgi:hypothetical protein
MQACRSVIRAAKTHLRRQRRQHALRGVQRAVRDAPRGAPRAERAAPRAHPCALARRRRTQSTRSPSRARRLLRATVVGRLTAQQPHGCGETPAPPRRRAARRGRAAAERPRSERRGINAVRRCTTAGSAHTRRRRSQAAARPRCMPAAARMAGVPTARVAGARCRRALPAPAAVWRSSRAAAQRLVSAAASKGCGASPGGVGSRIKRLQRAQTATLWPTLRGRLTALTRARCARRALRVLGGHRRR